MSIIRFKEANCKNCYKCIRSCPVKAIAFENEQAAIVEQECILCGNCLRVCPQNAKSVKNDVDRVRGFLENGEKVYVSLAPSFVAAFETRETGRVFKALYDLGFTHVEETAVGAVQVSREYERMMQKGEMPNIITSACPSVNSLVQKYYPGLVDQLAPVVSPMLAHAKMLRSMYGPRIRIVFIGPCIAKKEECRDLQNDSMVDAVLTFEELGLWLEAEGVRLEEPCGREIRGIKDAKARFYPVPGGIIKTLASEARKKYRSVSIDGVDRCIEILNSIKEDGLTGYFIEMNCCAGGCMGGPCISLAKGGFLEARDRLLDYVRRGSGRVKPGLAEAAKVSFEKTFVEKTLVCNIPSEQELREILNGMGKFERSKELNCGACGYSTCRDKALAVFNKKADLRMCLPYMRERAESISNIIIETTPNAIFALDKELRIQEFNLSAQKTFGLDGKELHGSSIYEVLECEDFEKAVETGESVIDRKYYYDKYDLTVLQSVLYVREQEMVILVLKDISREEKNRRQRYEVRAKTVDIAQKVIEKQMIVAQEIASLLGETTAETKVALTRLKSTIMSEAGDGE